MFKLNKENELASIQKKVDKLENENKRLRNELQALQKTCSKLRQVCLGNKMQLLRVEIDPRSVLSLGAGNWGN